MVATEDGAAGDHSTSARTATAESDISVTMPGMFAGRVRVKEIEIRDFESVSDATCEGPSCRCAGVSPLMLRAGYGPHRANLASAVLYGTRGGETTPVDTAGVDRLVNVAAERRCGHATVKSRASIVPAAG